MPVEIELRPRYVRLARELAEKRNASFEERDDYDNDSYTWGVDPIERDFQGLLGELAFAEYADLQIDTSTTEWSDGGYDFQVKLCGERKTVDIKTSNKEPKALMVKEYAVNADYYVLGHVEESTVRFYGGATSESVENGIRKDSPLGHTNLTLGRKYLEPLPNPEEIEPIT